MDAALAETIRLRRAGDHAAVVALLAPMSRAHPSSAPVAGMLGGSYFELGRLREAARCFGTAVRFAPTSAVASLGLFHSLWDLNRQRAALDEISRFLAVAESAEYDAILRDLAVAGKLSIRRETAGAA